MTCDRSQWSTDWSSNWSGKHSNFGVSCFSAVAQCASLAGTPEWPTLRFGLPIKNWIPLAGSQASWCELMAVRAPTVNREWRAPLPKSCGCATLPPFEFSAVHKFLAGGNGDSQLWQVRFTTQSPRFTTWFTTFGRAMARIGDLAAEIAILTAVRGALALVLSSLPCCFFLGAHRFGRTALVSRVGGCGTPVGSSGGICVYF